MSFNFFHYLVFAIVILLFLLGVINAFRQKNKNMVFSMLLTVTLFSALLGALGVAIVEKYTKEVKIYKVQNRRYLSLEKITYFGYVKNTGEFPVAKVYLTIKLINAGHATGNVKGGTFFQSSGFFDFFSKGANVLYKPQTIQKEFIIAKNLQPGEVVPFRVTFKYPPYFRNTSDVLKVYAH